MSGGMGVGASRETERIKKVSCYVSHLQIHHKQFREE